MKELKHLTRFLLLITCVGLLIGTASACECYSPGYWKNHPDEWPVERITIGGTEYIKGDADTEGTAIYFMSQPVKGDKTITMFKALVAAKLNEANGCTLPDCI
ncbi:hypothetical protein ACSAZK_08900 [Methanosarcina sp. Mfa9]|uniref:hypothetical protein n=1 Tax=Methanosarcina sp. Mfa9 TaxID=3439063 RepID=UPI003F8268DA